MKYPRTYHLPWSPGATNDDKRLGEGWFDYYKGKEIIITEKLDGENIHMDQRGVYARSDGAPTTSPWSRNMWDQNDGLYWRIKSLIGEDETIYGENLYGEHSIHYDCLTDYFHVFAVNDGFIWYDWDSVKEFANLLGVPHVPELGRFTVRDEREIREFIENWMTQESTYSTGQGEGVVVRLASDFPIKDFPHYVCKYVRPNHVQTDEHWTKNWQKARLI